MISEQPKEVVVFEAFVPLTPFKNNFLQFERADPPFPDIKCTLKSGEAIFFELFEIVDKNLMQNIDFQIKSQQLVESALKKNHSPEKADFFYKNAGLEVFISFKDEFKRVKDVIDEVLSYVFSLKSFPPKLSSFPDKLASYLKAIYFEKEKSLEPKISILPKTFELANPIISIIEKKLKKQYPESIPVELLCYYNFPMHEELESLKCMIKKIDFSKANYWFRRLWLFDSHNRKIVFFYDNKILT